MFKLYAILTVMSVIFSIANPDPVRKGQFLMAAGILGLLSLSMYNG
jgi:hypothetical protein